MDRSVPIPRRSPRRVSVKLLHAMKRRALLFGFLICVGLAAVARWGTRRPASPPERRSFDPLATLTEKELLGLRAGKPSLSNMVLVPAGKFIMGSPDGQEDERPQREVYLDAYYIDRTEVTNKQYQEFVKATGHRSPKASLRIHLPLEWKDGTYPEGRGDHPVLLVSWEDAVAYSIWAGKRLPTEAEWEKAARGADGRDYPWGKLWDKSLCNSGKSGIRGTTRVGTYPGGASPFGCLDMAGNVQEWCLDIYERRYYSHAISHNPQGAEAGVAGVVRGGSWADSDVRSANRSQVTPPHRLTTIGFRCALSAPSQVERPTPATSEGRTER